MIHLDPQAPASLTYLPWNGQTSILNLDPQAPASLTLVLPDTGNDFIDLDPQAPASLTKSGRTRSLSRRFRSTGSCEPDFTRCHVSRSRTEFRSTGSCEPDSLTAFSVCPSFYLDPQAPASLTAHLRIYSLCFSEFRSTGSCEPDWLPFLHPP